MTTSMIETRRRSVTKSLLWRFIGIIWTWIGAYLILLFAPEPYRSAAWIATLIVIYHHSTRMIMYYGYERAWDRVKWGRSVERGEDAPSLSARGQIIWCLATLFVIVVIFVLILYVIPLVKR